jgi:hypothetical protein
MRMPGLVLPSSHCLLYRNFYVSSLKFEDKTLIRESEFTFFAFPWFHTQFIGLCWRQVGPFRKTERDVEARFAISTVIEKIS